MSKRIKSQFITLTFGLFAVSTLAVACGSWQPVPTPGDCATDRHWVAAQETAEGEWKEGYCAWDEGRGPNDPRW